MPNDRANRQLVGVGLYSFAEAARLLRVPAARVRRWIDERKGVVRRRFAAESDMLSFLELMELYFVKAFREQGVSLDTIRKASQAAARKFHAEYPFAVKRFDTDGRAIFATLIKENPKDVLIEDLEKGQLVFEKIVKPFFRRIEYRNEAIRFWPMEPRGRVVLDPGRSFGKPIDAETGVPTRAIYDAVMAGQDHKTVAAWFGVPVRCVDAAVEFERSIAA